MNLFSSNRVNMSHEGARYDDISGNSFIDYLFPIVKYHDRLVQGEMTLDDFMLKFADKNRTQGFQASNVTLTQAPQEPGMFFDTVREMPKARVQELQNILDFCDTLDADVLFVASPFSTNKEAMGRLNHAGQIITERGYPFLNCNNQEIVDEMGIDWQTDYYNKNHTNYLGAEKYTDYLSTYLKGHYNLPDRRGDSKYAAWEAGYEAYEDFVKDGIRFRSSENVADE